MSNSKSQQDINLSDLKMSLGNNQKGYSRGYSCRWSAAEIYALGVEIARLSAEAKMLDTIPDIKTVGSVEEVFSNSSKKRRGLFFKLNEFFSR